MNNVVRPRTWEFPGRRLHPWVAVLFLVLTTTGPALAGTCDALRRQREKLEEQLTELRVEYPIVVAAVEACVVAARAQPKQDQDAALGACLALVCLGAGEETCKDVSRAIFNLVAKKLRHDVLYRQNRCDRSEETGEVASYDILVQNRCSSPVTVAIRYMDAGGVWRSGGWWSVGGGGTTYLADEDNVRIKTVGATMYFYAESTDGSQLSWRGQRSVFFRGANLPMRQVDDPSGDTEITLTCD